MKSRVYAALLAGALPAASLATTPPPPGDFLALLLAKDIQARGTAAALARADRDYARQMLADPDSPYAEVTTSAPPQNEIAWEEARTSFAALHGPVSDAQALAMQQWDLGFTKSRPGIEVPLVPASF